MIIKYVNRPKGTAVKDIDEISILPIFWGHKYRCHVDMSKGYIDPPLIQGRI